MSSLSMATAVCARNVAGTTGTGPASPTAATLSHSRCLMFIVFPSRDYWLGPCRRFLLAGSRMPPEALGNPPFQPAGAGLAIPMSPQALRYGAPAPRRFARRQDAVDAAAVEIEQCGKRRVRGQSRT